MPTIKLKIARCWKAPWANKCQVSCGRCIVPLPPSPPLPSPPPPSPPLPSPSPFCASTTATSGWVQYGNDGIYRDVDISGCGFTSAPTISSGLTGLTAHWTAKGGSSQYTITATGFRVYVNQPGITAAKAIGYGWKIGWIASPPIMSSTFCASTTATSGWVQYGNDGIYRDVDISGCGFTSAPTLSSSLTNSWTASGGSSQYHITATGFRVYVYYPGITIAQATSWNWKIGWMAEPNV